MSEYINREVLRKVLSHELVDADTGTPMDFYNMGIRTLRRMIEDIPAADVQPVKHGKWMYCSIEDVFHCTVCDAAAVRNTFVYCPICGARMDGET